MEIKYVKMPISIEEKKDYNRQGFRVVDERFAPVEAESEEKPVKKTKTATTKE